MEKFKDRWQMTESDHMAEENKLFDLNNGKFEQIESMTTMCVLKKRNNAGWIKDAFVVHIKDDFLGLNKLN